MYEASSDEKPVFVEYDGFPSSNLEAVDDSGRKMENASQSKASPEITAKRLARAASGQSLEAIKVAA